jgi:hypothetical protein
MVVKTGLYDAIKVRTLSIRVMSACPRLESPVLDGPNVGTTKTVPIGHQGKITVLLNGYHVNSLYRVHGCVGDSIELETSL